MTNKIINIMIILTLSSICFANQQEEVTQVTLNQDTIFYNGTLTQEANYLVFNAYNKAKIKPNNILISSRGGDVELGMELGSWIYDKNLNVTVQDYCLSSCANYVFTAGKYKYISNHAIIGFHGGLTSQSFDTSKIDEMYSNLPQDEREKEISQFYDLMRSYIERVKIKENNFFTKINVKQEITTLGQNDKYNIFDFAKYSGWTYLPQDYPKLGVNNVIVEKPPWQLIQLKDFGSVFIVHLDN